MNFFRHVFFIAVCLATFKIKASEPKNFDADWNFLKADAPGAEQTGFADSDWRKLNLPHDWSIEGPFAQTNLTGGAGAFLPSGIGWYRKHFSLAKMEAGKTVSVTFDGVMQNSDVWINGFHLTQRPSGYVGFTCDLSGHLSFDGDNVLAVRTDTSAQPASRWYSGAGIYRHVHLTISEPVHVAENGVFVSTPQVSETAATVKIETHVVNQANSERLVRVQSKLISPDGKMIAMLETDDALLRVPGENTFTQQIVFANPERWDLNSPKLHRVVTEIRASGKLLDTQTTVFGIRQAEFIPETGFWLNGKNFKLNGVCLHHDGGAFGAAVPLSIWENRLTTLKSLGVNAIRTAHNPPAPEFLDLCDRLGLLVMDEFFDCWTRGKNSEDYHLFFRKWAHTDERDTILRDRNHPSIIIYSVGNEIPDTHNAERAKGILTNLVAIAHAADPTRPVTQALFRPNVSGDYTNGLADLLDVVGQNYREQEILAAHEQNPARKIVGTENTHDRKQWIAVRDHAPYAGQFLWTGIDYLGESKYWPTVGYGSGLLNRTGAIRPFAHERASWWNDAPLVSVNRRISANDLMPTDPGYGGEEKHTQVVFADWTPKDLAPHSENVEVYSNAKEVELFLNGHSLGVKNLNADAAPRLWQVPFVPGKIKAVARDGKKIVATDELQTAGKAAKIILSTESKKLSPNFEDVAVVRAKIVDAKGVEIPRANDLITFKISGVGKIAAVDNGDNGSHELFQTNSRHAFQGECVAFVKATAISGKITVTATANGLASDSVTLKAELEKHQ